MRRTYIRQAYTWAVLGMALLLAGGCASQRRGEGMVAPVVVYAGPNMKTSVEALAKTYEAKTGQTIRVESSDPRTLITWIEGGKGEHPRADLFVSHDPFLIVLENKQIAVTQWWEVARLEPTLAVLKGNPKNIRGLADLARPDVRVCLTANTAISSYIGAAMLRRAGIEQQVEANIVKRVPNGRDIAETMLAGEADSGIVWNAVSESHRERIEMVPIEPKLILHEGDADATASSAELGSMRLDHVKVTVALLKGAPNAKAAKRFALYMTSKAGEAAFLERGFSSPTPR